MTKAKKKPTAADFSHLNTAMNAEGFEDANLQTMAVPFLRVLQDLSPQLKPSKPEYIKGAVAGQIVNTVSGKLYDAPLKIVIGKFERIFIEWGTVRGKLMGVHAPEYVETTIAQRLVRNEKNKLVDPTTGHVFEDTYTYYVVMPEHMNDGVCIVSMKSTDIKEAKKLNRNMLHTIIPGTDQRALPYFMVWDLDTAERSNDQGEWFGVTVKFNEFVSQTVLEHVVEEREALPNKTVDYAQLEAPSADSDDNGATY